MGLSANAGSGRRSSEGSITLMGFVTCNTLRRLPFISPFPNLFIYVLPCFIFEMYFGF